MQNGAVDGACVRACAGECLWHVDLCAPAEMFQMKIPTARSHKEIEQLLCLTTIALMGMVSVHPGVRPFRLELEVSMIGAVRRARIEAQQLDGITLLDEPKGLGSKFLI